MSPPILEIDGTGTEIAERLSAFADRRLHVVVTDSEVPATDPRLRLLQEIRERWASMDPRPATRDYIREGRSGDMYGYEPAE